MSQNNIHMLIDSYGAYKIITGNEGSGRCWWCGGAFPDKRKRRYCSAVCRRKYEESFYWSWASVAAIRRARYRCKECGIKGKRRLHVHHIIPLNGTDRIVNALNRRENLVVLCRKCHQRKHEIRNSKHKSAPPTTLNI
jgi:5-methylcytosine-specific restriction endonuclease McrA